MRGDVVEVTITIGDSIVTTGHADGPVTFDWAPDHVLAPPAERDVPVRTQIGLAEVTLTRVAAPERTLPYTSDLDRRAWRYLAISLAVHLLMWGVAMTQPPIRDRPHTAPHEDRPVYIHSSSAPWQPPREEVDGDDTDTGGGGVVSMHLEQRDRPEIALSDDGEVESTAGMLGTTTSTAELLAALTSDKVYSSSADESQGFGPLNGPGTEGTSGFGAARSSFSGGGGCTEEPCGTVGVLHYEPLSETANIGNGWGLMARDHSTGPTCTLHWDTVTSTGDLGKTEIRRYIRDHLDKLTYCYEAQLLADPTLGGELALSFEIEANGHVVSVVASGVSPEVETCVAGVIRAIEFPKAIGGGASQVNYPLTFRVAK